MNMNDKSYWDNDDRDGPPPSCVPTTTTTSNKNEELGVRLQEGGKQYSIQSTKTLDRLEDLKHSYESMKHQVEQIRKSTDLSDYLSVSRSKCQLAQLLGSIEKLQFNKLDAVCTVNLHSGKQEAKSNRRELNAALDALQEEVSSLYAEYDKVPRPPSSSSSSSSHSTNPPQDRSCNSPKKEDITEKELNKNDHAAVDGHVENTYGERSDNVSSITQKGGHESLDFLMDHMRKQIKELAEQNELAKKQKKQDKKESKKRAAKKNKAKDEIVAYKSQSQPHEQYFGISPSNSYIRPHAVHQISKERAHLQSQANRQQPQANVLPYFKNM